MFRKEQQKQGRKRRKTREENEVGKSEICRRKRDKRNDSRNGECKKRKMKVE
jgi:hypothetical protein